MQEQLMIIFQIVLIVFILVGLLYLLRYLISVRYEKRIQKYVVDDYRFKGYSLFEKIEYRYICFEKSLTKVLDKFRILKNYSKKYLPFINRDNQYHVTALDLVSRKIIISFSFVLTILISDILRNVSFSYFQVFFGFIVGFYFLDILFIFCHKKDIKEIEEDLYKAISIMNNSFKAGKSIMQAICIVAEEMDGEIKEEFSYMYNDLKHGLDLEDVLIRFSKRVDLDEVKYMTTSLIVLNKTGGNIADIFKTIDESILSRRKLKQELKMLTASSELVFKILVVLPVITSIFIYTLNSNYFRVLLTTSIGNIILTIILLLYIIYIFVIRRIMKVEGI